MTSPFRNQGTPLLRSFARKDREQDSVSWKVRSRGGQRLVAEEFRESDNSERQGLRLEVESSDPTAPFSYVRGEFAFPELGRGDRLKIDLAYALTDAPGVFFVLELHRNAELTDLIHAQRFIPPAATVSATASFEIELDPALQGGAPIYGYIQACLTTDAGAVIELTSLTVNEVADNTDFRPLRIRYEVFGGRTSASSRLRCWKFIDILQAEGHTVTVGGSETNVDLLICQKTRPFKIVDAVRRANPQAVIVYDFDDNYLLPSQGVQAEVVAFLNLVDVVTCGSEYLAVMAREFHPNVYVLENPLDIDHPNLVRPERGRLNRVGWFGAPENLAEVRKIDGGDQVITLTRGGDVEYNQLTIDADLTEFDLLLFPVEATEWNLAKNANRMMKAVGLGVPVLVSDTPEQARIHELAGLPKACLISGFVGWQTRISKIASGFAQIEADTLKARDILWAEYNPRAVLERLFAHISATTALGRSLNRSVIKDTEALGQFAALVVDGTVTGAAAAGLSASRVDWSSFSRVGVFTAGRLENSIYGMPGDRLSLSSGDFLSAYAAADRFIESLEVPNLFFAPPGVALGSAMVKALKAFADQKQCEVAIFAYSGHSSHSLNNRLGSMALADLLKRPMATGPIAVKTAWLRKNPVQWRETLDLWQWRLLVAALAQRVAIEAHELPLCFQAFDKSYQDPARNFASWCESADPRRARELPDLAKQWDRMLTDIVTPAAALAHEDLPMAFGQLMSEVSGLRRRVQQAESALKAARSRG
jgi:hypothetical protein